MGRDKSRVRLGPRTLLGQIRTAASEFSPVRIIRRDLKPQCGPLGGVHTALTASRAEVIIFLACDMPFISFDLLRRLAARMSSKTRPSLLLMPAGWDFRLPSGNQFCPWYPGSWIRENSRCKRSPESSKPKSFMRRAR